MAYATEADLVAEAGGLPKLNELLPTSALGLSDLGDIRDYWIAQAIARGDDRLNAYIRTRYQTPLATVFPHTIRLAAEEAIYWLWSVKGNVPEEVVTKAEVRLAELGRIRDGKLIPGEPFPEPTSGKRSKVVESCNPWRAQRLGGLF